jgi:HlyD family type I secretion membrane fusion protein
MRLDPSTLVTRMPVDLFQRYRRGISAPDGSLDDSSHQIRNGLLVLAGFFIIGLIWAAFAPLSGAAVANGVVTVAGNRQTLQTLNGGVVDQVLVREGQQVRAGQILMRMNPLSTGGGFRRSQSQRDDLAAVEARLIAERDGLQTIVWPADFSARSSEASVAQAMRSQAALFDSRRRAFSGDAAGEAAQVEAARIAVEGPRRQLEFVNERLAGLRSLYSRGFAPKAVVYELEAAKVQLETEIARGGVELQRAELAASRAREGRLNDVLTELRMIQAELQQVGPALDTARFAAERDTVRAPVDGAVVDLAPAAPGSILSPGQKLMDVLPSGRALIVEARIRPEDVDDVRVGSHADVRFTSVNPRGMAKIGGRVTTLSADRLTDPATGVGYYLAYIALDAEQVARADLDLTAGLPASVNVKTRDRSFLNYLFAPLTDSFAKAGREE